MVSSVLEHTTQHGAIEGKTQTRPIKFYNLDAIISVGYRVNSIQATQFCIWVTERLKEYIIKGFTMDDERLKNPNRIFGEDYFEEQLARIRDIRSSERRFYQKITDIYAECSGDYNKTAKRTRIASWGKLSTSALIDIARVYLESNDIETAYSWLKKIPKNETYQAYERDKLLLEIYRRQGDNDKLTELLYQKLRTYHSTETLQELLDVIGEDKRDEVIAKEVVLILDNPKLSETDAEFLISIGKIDKAEEYLLKKADQINGDFYNTLLPLVEAMELANRHLAASLLYCSLLVSILKRGYSKAYPYGIRYLKKLDKLALAITNWKTFNNHEAFRDKIVQDHGRKRSF